MKKLAFITAAGVAAFALAACQNGRLSQEDVEDTAVGAGVGAAVGAAGAAVAGEDAATGAAVGAGVGAAAGAAEGEYYDVGDNDDRYDPDDQGEKDD